MIESIHVDLMLQNDDDTVIAEADGADFGAERDLRGPVGLSLVPENDLVERKLGVGPTAYKGQDAASEVHLDGGFGRARGKGRS